uniref:NADH dehydrogenase subunit 6 n=1 Tax=Nigidius sinicus TaxID=2950530 RepID=UPI0021154BF0|nr:NADH dehydrogenase subunit 6 [Nigidius sinicus]USR68906.1 NADH dehydrogenase subunit 6 [Nigidius sinicus]
MTMLTILLSSILMSFMILLTKHPLTLGMSLLIQTLMITLISSMMNSSSWFSYILFLIMVGGMLVLFMYMTSVASNEKFKFSLKMTFMWMTYLSIIVPAYIIDPWTSWTSINSSNMNSSLFTLLNKFLNFPLIIISMTTIIFLFLALVTVIKITDIKYGPLRTMN